MNQHWPRWIKASIYKYFEDNKATYNLFLEGDNRATTLDWATWLELQIIDLKIQGGASSFYNIDLTINGLAIVLVDQESTYIIDTMVGYFASKYTPICVYKYGSGVEDDDTYLGTLELISDVRITPYGQVDESRRYLQTTIDGDYHMSLIGD